MPKRVQTGSPVYRRGSTRVDENMLCVVPDKLPPHQRGEIKPIHSHECLYLWSVWHMDDALYMFEENGSLPCAERSILLSLEPNL